jgi:bla regulator protein BlaR1
VEILEKIFLFTLQISLSASISALLIILILKLFNKYIGIRVKNILLILLLIRFLVPITPDMNTNFLNTLYQKCENTLNLSKGNTNLELAKFDSEVPKKSIENNIYNEKTQIETEDKTQSTNKQNSILKIISCIWIIGVLIIDLILFLSMLIFKRKTKHLETDMYPEIQSVIELCKDKANVSSNISFYVCDDLNSPCILGITKPKIYLPKHILNINDNNLLSHIFLHELFHYKRKDLLCNFLSTIIFSIHWFNPIVWFLLNKIKLYREYACDACVLELLGEKEAIKYGMSLINLSKMFLNKTNHSNLAIFFETNNQMKGRIEMIKKFKTGSYRISIIGVLGCVLITVIMLTNSINVNALDINTNKLATESSTAINTPPKFIVDTPEKSYYDIEKVEKVAGFKFKLPDSPQLSRASSLQLIKLSDQDNVLLIYLDGDTKFTFQVSEKDPLEYLKKIATVKGGSKNYIESKEESMKLGDIDGFNVILTQISPSQTLKNGDVIPERKDVDKYFAWKNEGLWYSIRYNSPSKSSGKNANQGSNISQNNIETIAKSIVYPDEIKNVKYSVEKDSPSTEIATMMIYDKEDLESAKKYLGFNPKFPLKINEDITINQSAVGISDNSDIKNNNISYELDNIYRNKNGSITFNQKKASKEYEDMKKSGYTTIYNNENNKTEQIKVQKLTINNNDVFKYLYDENYPDGTSGSNGEYFWKENNIYYSVCFFGNTANSDEIAKEFITSNPID